jgi:DNA transposition AAA+ family ATPase
MLPEKSSNSPPNPMSTRLSLVREWPADAAITQVRWEALVMRLIAAYSNNMTPARLAREASAGQVRGVSIDAQWLALFTTQPEIVRGNTARLYSDQPSGFELRVSALESALDRHETERRTRGEPGQIETSVARAVCEAIAEARALTSIVQADADPGIGKSQGADYYISRCRAAEGFACPAWKIRLDAAGVSLRVILCQIADEIIGAGHYGGTDVAIANDIAKATEGTGGVLIIDEAQHLAEEISGPRILNALRSFAGTDKGCFGLVLLGNGEIYRRYNTAKYAQLQSRMDHRVEILGLDAGEHDAKKNPHNPKPALQVADVRAIAEEWGVTDLDAVALSINIARKPGALRALTNLYKRARHEWGEINHRTMIATRRA